MIHTCYLFRAQGTDPYENLALEEHLLSWLPPHAVLLYLWQNDRTVVIGRNQNAWQECDIGALEADGGKLARRLSGGGAVYHDMGNLNFTFIAHAEAYDVTRQMRIVLRAVEGLGLPAKLDGRNDITVEGRKFSGNAFYRAQDRALHHGTLMVSTDLQCLVTYLQVSKLKLAAKGVDSVRSRVVNLQTLASTVTVPVLMQALEEAFCEEYGGMRASLGYDEIDWAAVRTLCRRYAAYDWRMGRHAPFTGSAETRFSWGNVCFTWAAHGGHIADCALYSDAMEAEAIAQAPGLLTGCPLDGTAMASALASMGNAMLRTDLCAWFHTMFGGE